MKILCPICKGRTQEYREAPFRTGRKNPASGKEIVIKEAFSYCCMNCKFEWLTKAQEEKIEKEIFKQIYKPIKSENIARLRNSLPISTKKALANFLCLNEKAFVHWEKEGAAPNPAYDLLLRLVARSEDNFNFVKKLHEKGFEFDPEDYFFISSEGRAKCK